MTSYGTIVYVREAEVPGRSALNGKSRTVRGNNDRPKWESNAVPDYLRESEIINNGNACDMIDSRRGEDPDHRYDYGNIRPSYLGSGTAHSIHGMLERSGQTVWFSSRVFVALRVLSCNLWSGSQNGQECRKPWFSC